jgi:alpha-L-fucosidase 2
MKRKFSSSTKSRCNSFTDQTRYTQYKYSIDMNFASNGFSVYTTSAWPYALTAPFQIDANFGLVGAALAMLATDLPRAHGDNQVQTILLGPAIPTAWSPGRVRGLRLRGGGSVDFSWASNGIVEKAKLNSRKLPLVIMNREDHILAKV